MINIIIVYDTYMLSHVCVIYVSRGIIAIATRGYYVQQIGHFNFNQ